MATTELDKYETMRRLALESGQRVAWEYWDGTNRDRSRSLLVERCRYR